ncbi:MAG: sodium-dependent transporter [Candidatus Faecivicinus sp.]
MQNRERFGSRLGFILISAGCAIGLGNVWKFPYITAANGGAAFILVYLLFLLILGIPVLTMEFAVGRASRKSILRAYGALEPGGTRWHLAGYLGVAGNYILMMFYTVVSGWMLFYLFKMLRGDFAGLDAAAVAGQFAAMTGNAPGQTVCMLAMTALGFGICAIGLEKGVERVTKVMMLLLIGLMLCLSVRSVTLPGAEAGIEYYLKPDFSKIFGHGLDHFNRVVFAAMAQAFFTLSIGMGSMAIFGTYIGRDRSLTGEAVTVTLLDTFVAIMAGMIIIPACFAYGIDLQAGPKLIFITLPNVFNAMPNGRLWGSLFFLFMLFAALSTLTGVFENILSFAMDARGWSRKKAALVNALVIAALSMPALLGYNLLSGVQPLGAGSTILDFEDFIVSNNILPIGSLIYVLFCTLRSGWGFDRFLEEANTGRGLRFPARLRGYCRFALPLIIAYVLVMGYISYFR